MARNAHDVAQVQQLEKFESLLANHIQTRINLQSSAVAGEVCEACFAVRSQRDEASRHAHFHSLGTELLRCPVAKLRRDLPGRMRPRKLVRVGGVPEGLDFTQLFAALKKLVERFKFQRDIPFDTLAVGVSRAFAVSRAAV